MSMIHTPGQPVSPEVKAQVISDLLSGIRPEKIKECYNVSLPTISRIKRSIAPELLEKLHLDKQEAIGDMVVTLLERSIEGAINIANMTSDGDWMRTQTADHLNKMYGTMVDKAVRITEVYEFATEADKSDELGGQAIHIENQQTN